MGRLFTFVISLVVVGTALVLAIRVALSEEPKPPKPATPVVSRDRATRSARHRVDARREMAAVASIEPTPLQRVRSALVLTIILAVLGGLAALLVLFAGAVVLTGLRNAVQ